MIDHPHLGRAGELSCVCIDDAHSPADTWYDQVLVRVRRAVRAGMPVVYVDSGGYDLNTEIVRSEIGPSPLLLTVSDEDRVLLIPLPDDPRTCSAVSYGLPTLTVAEEAVVAHQKRCGPTMLVVDEIDFARPFAGIDDEAAGGPGMENLAQSVVTLAVVQVQQWRASELLRLARQRPTRPTIVVARSCRVANTVPAWPMVWLCTGPQSVGGVAGHTPPRNPMATGDR